MLEYHLQSCAIVVTLAMAVAIGARRLRILDNAIKIIWVLLLFALITECLAYYTAFEFHNNRPVYSIFSLLEFLFVSLYFNESIPFFKNHSIGIWIGVAGLTFGIVNFFYQPVDESNSNFLLVEAISIIAMSMAALVYLLLRRQYFEIRKSPEALIPMIFIFNWSLTSVSYGLIDVQGARNFQWIMDLSVFCTSILTNILFSVLFIRYPKMKPVKCISIPT